MVQVLRLLRRLPVGVSKKIEDKVEDIAVFINRELLPFLQELRESTAATFEQVTTDTLLGRDTPGSGDVEEISLDDTLEFTGSKSIQRAEITGDISIPAGSNVSAINAGVIVNADINSDANIAVSKFEDGLALSVLGVAGNSAGQYEDIQASTARHVVRLNDAGTSLEFEYPLEFNVEGIDSGDVFGIDIVGARGSVTAGVGEIDLLPQITTEVVTGTINAHVLPATLKHRDTLIFDPSANTTLNGIDLQDSLGVDWPEGFEFILHNSDATFTVTVVDESGSAIADDRISTPRNQTLVLGQSASLIFRRFVTRWGVIERAWPDASTSITYSGFELRRAALTGFAAASANSNATTSAEPIVTYSASANMSAERVLSDGTNTAVDVSVANEIRINVAASNALIPDGDKGDITVSASGATWNIDASAVGTTEIADDAVTVAKLAHGPIGSTLVSFGSFANPMWCHVMTEQFLGPIGDARFIGNSWIWNTAGSMNVSDITSIAAHAGIRRFTRTAASGIGTSMAYVGDSSTDPAIDIADVAFLYFVVRAPTVAVDQTSLSDKRIIIGLVADASDASDLGGDGLVLILDLDGVTTWRIKDENSSASTFTATATATIDEWVECLLVNEGSGSWGVLVNGTDYGTHSGVITSGTLVPAVICNSTAAVGSILDVDEFTIGFLASANRYG